MVEYIFLDTGSSHPGIASRYYLHIFHKLAHIHPSKCINYFDSSHNSNCIAGIIHPNTFNNYLMCIFSSIFHFMQGNYRHILNIHCLIYTIGNYLGKISNYSLFSRFLMGIEQHICLYILLVKPDMISKLELNIAGKLNHNRFQVPESGFIPTKNVFIRCLHHKQTALL
jgi:glycosylphosphatidylinositol transamidase (GPIT) subunit GPI8